MTPEVFIEQAKLYSSIGELTFRKDLDNDLLRMELRASINGYRSELVMNLTTESLSFFTPEVANILLGTFYASLLRHCLEKTYKPHFECPLIEVQISIAEETDDT